jgi:hypothetical protein
VPWRARRADGECVQCGARLLKVTTGHTSGESCPSCPVHSHGGLDTAR